VFESILTLSIILNSIPIWSGKDCPQLLGRELLYIVQEGIVVEKILGARPDDKSGMEMWGN